MEPFAIKQATFLTSVGLGTPYPPAVDTGVEIAMVGKSNVGKSSLINSLCNNFKLARVSSSPGKTRLINYFLINREFYLVDLPGYGFAKAPKTEQQKWGQLMESYLSSGRVTHIFLLLDIRHAPTAEDKQMFQWILYYGVPFTLVPPRRISWPKANGPRQPTLRPSFWARLPLLWPTPARPAMGGKCCWIPWEIL